MGNGLILLKSEVKKSDEMAIDITTVAPMQGFIESIFNGLFDLHLCAIEPVRPVHKNHGGW